MSRHKRSALRVLLAAAIPAGIAAAFAFLAPVASAATDTGVHLASASLIAAAGTHLPGQAPGTGNKARPCMKKRRHCMSRNMRAYKWARSQAGHPYVYGGTGPGFDCSGLVMMAYRHAGVHLPRTTYEMLSSRLLVRVRHPKTGDLAFYGTGHVELFVKWGFTYGAHDSGTRVSRIHYGWGWKPTAYYRVK